MEKLNDQIYVIKEFLSQDECKQFIQMSESIGYEVATVETERGPKFIDSIRNNYRILHQDFQLGNQL